jgi:hypothetical protein
LFYLLIDVSQKRRGAPPEEFQRDVVAARLRSLGKATGKDYLSRAEEIIALTRLRNLLLHSGGDWVGFPEDKDPAIQRWMAGHPELTSQRGAAIVLLPSFFPYCLGLYDSWIRDLLEDVRGI